MESVPATLHPEHPSARTIRVRVRGGYEPAVLRACVGEHLRIVFSREETAPCSERVLFPAFGRSAMLPPFEDVALDLVPERAGEYEFTCQLGMLRGRLVVEDAGAKGPRTVPAPASEAKPRRGPFDVACGNRDTALLVLATWLCTIPLLLLVTVPLVGWRAGGALALVWLGAVVAVCFAVCARRIRIAGRRGTSVGSPHVHSPS